MACWSVNTKAVSDGLLAETTSAHGPLHLGEFLNERLPVHDSVQNLEETYDFFQYSEFRNIPSCRSVSALGAGESRSVELLGSEYSALPI
jgi:hypothetical protein